MVRLLEDHEAEQIDALCRMNKGLRCFEPFGLSLEVVRQARSDFAERKGFVAGICVGEELLGVLGLTNLHKFNRRAWVGYFLGAVSVGIEN